MSTSDKLVRMANQIARNLQVKGETAAIQATAEHIEKFWDRRMRATMNEHMSATQGEGLSAIAASAFRILRSG